MVRKFNMLLTVSQMPQALHHQATHYNNNYNNYYYFQFLFNILGSDPSRPGSETSPKEERFEIIGARLFTSLLLQSSDTAGWVTGRAKSWALVVTV